MPQPPTIHVSKDAAFARFQQTDEYASLRSFALDPENVDNALRLTFDAGWRMACGLPADAVVTTRDQFDHPSDKA